MTTNAPETEIVTRWKVACDGGGGSGGHPRVWMVIPDETGFVVFSRCGLLLCGQYQPRCHR